MSKEVIYMADLQRTQNFSSVQEKQVSEREVLEKVYQAFEETGYNPVNQIVGYIMSGDPTYVTNYGGARTLISKVERDEILEELMKVYIEVMQSRY